MGEHDGGTGTSRREILKRLGAGATIVWATPLLTTTAAHAQSGTPRPCDCANNPCGLAPPNVCGTGQFGDCLCAATLDVGCDCFQPLCFPDTCSSSADCDPGFACVNCCGEPTCAPLCGTVIGARGEGEPWAH